MPPDRRALLAQLQAEVAQLRGAPRLLSGATVVGQAPESGLETGLEPMELRRLPRPGITELCGRPGTGRLRLLVPTLTRLTQRGDRAALLDPLGRLYPPGLEGVVLEQLLVVQPPPEQLGWAAEQLARSGLFALVVLLDPPRLGRAGARLARAVEQGGGALAVLTERPDPALPADLRLRTLGWRGPRLALELTRGAPGTPPRTLELELGPGQAPPPAP